jgi:hypothetical protein
MELIKTSQGSFNHLRLNFFSVIIYLFNLISVLHPQQDFKVSESQAAVFGVAIDTDSAGNFIIVWDDSRNIKIPYGGTGGENDIYAQRYNNGGIRVGNNFRISDDSLGNDASFAGQYFPSVSMNDKGDFVVVWVDTRTKENLSGVDFNIYAQRFDSNGNPIGQNFLVNDSLTSGQLNPDIILQSDGSFIIVWTSTIDNSNFYLQSFDSKGIKIGSNKKLLISGMRPKLALFKNGNFIVVGDSSAQIFSFFANELGEPFKTPMGFTKDVEICSNRILISQVENRIVANQFIDSDIFLYQFDTLGHYISRSKVNDDLTNYWQVQPSLSVGNGNILLIWQDYRNGYEIGDGECIDIYIQRFNDDFVKIENNIKLSHEENSSGQFHPTAVVWEDKIYAAWLDGRSLESYTNVFPSVPKLDVWFTVQNFNNPIEGEIIYCSPPTQMPLSFHIYDSYPNPTNSNCILSYDLSEDSEIKIIIYNIIGEEIKILINKYLVAGEYEIKFDASDLASGVYIYRIQVNDFVSTKKMMLLK